MKSIKTIINNILNKLKQTWSDIKYIFKVYDLFDYEFENPFNIWFNKSIRQMFVLPQIKFNVHSVMYEPSFANDIFEPNTKL